MSAPKSVVKFKGSNVEYTSKVDFACYTLVELSRAAMKDVGKFITRTANRDAMKLHGLSKSKRVRGLSSTFRWKVPWAKTGLPHLEVGVTHNTWYGEEQEMGSSRMPRLGILTNAARANIAKIVEIESQYLSGLSDEARALSMISEGEYSGGGDD